jgi:methylmalonyl-CoA epimerase
MLHHIGIVVNNKDISARYWEKIGFKIDHRQVVQSQSVEVAFISLGNVWLELVQPVGEKTPVTNFLEKHGETMHHMCFAVKNVKKDSAYLQLISEPTKGFGESTIAFAHPKEFGKVLVEFVQDPPY